MPAAPLSDDPPASDAPPRGARGLDAILSPRSIAVIGASRSPEKVGGALFGNLLGSDYTGVVFPVNPSSPVVRGVMAWPSVRDVPAEVELAVIVVPARFVPQVVEDCAAKGVKGLVVITAGFGETGGEGDAREAALAEAAAWQGMRMVGPNCLGVINTDPDVAMNATFAPLTPPRGRVSMASQSGALGVALLDHAKELNLGVRQFVSLGNRADVSSNDLLEHWEVDEGTDVILLYLESFGNARRFGRIARRVARAKPIVAVKGGRTAAGARAAASHTGSLAGASVAAEALLRQAGVLQVASIEDLFGVAQVLAYQPPPRGGRVAIVTNAGGPGILAADACESQGLRVATLSAETTAALRSFLPPEASVANPIDTIASATAEDLGRALELVLADEGVDAVLLLFIPPLVTKADDVAAAVRRAARQGQGDKTLLTCFMMSRGVPVDLRLDEERYLPSFVFPEDAVRALALARDYARLRDEPEGRVRAFLDVDRAAARARFEAARPGQEGGWLMPESIAGLLADYGIPVAPLAVAHDAEEAAAEAERIGFPLAMKLRSATIVHKTDLGGVALDLRDAAAVREAYSAMRARVEAAGRGDEMEGVLLQPMVEGGQEVILGMTEDPVFGPLLMAGIGGIHVELLKDVAFSIHPLTDRDPERMLGQLRGLPLLTGWRGGPRADLPALEEALLRFSAFIEDFPEIDEVEINPVRVMPEGEGCLALDARARVGPRRDRSHDPGRDASEDPSQERRVQ